MTLTSADLEAPLRESFNAAFYHAVAFLSVSLIGALLLLPVITIGHVILGVVFATRYVLARGASHSSRDATRLFLHGIRENLWTGAALTIGLLSFGALLTTDAYIIVTYQSQMLRGIALVSMLVTGFGLLALPYIVVLMDVTDSVVNSIRDGIVIAFSNIRYSVLLAAVLLSVLVLSVLTVFGWAFIGFTFTTTLAVLATDTIYQEMGDESIIKFTRDSGIPA